METIPKTQSVNKWWANKRLKYNKGLVLSGIVAFLLYAILGGILIEPYDHDFEVTLFTTLFQGIFYLIAMGIANLLYFLGPLFDKLFNTTDNETFREGLFNLGYWFSVALPFSIPIIIVIQYFTIYRH